MANRIVRGLGWTTASTVIRNLVHLLQLAILTRFLDKADFGIVAIAHMFVGFTAMFLDMGISVGIIHRQNITNREYSSLFWLNIIFGVVLTSGLFILAPLVTAVYHSQDLTNVVQLLCLTIDYRFYYNHGGGGLNCHDGLWRVQFGLFHISRFTLH